MDESVLKFSVNSTQPLQNKTLDVGDFVVVKSTNHAPTFADEKYVEATFSVDITKKRSNSKTQPDSIMMDTDADATRTTPKSNANKKRTKSGKSSAAGLTGVGPGPSDSVNEPFDFSVLNDEN
uniref:Uncharacterized protein n=1 Tax=Timspurckia oligopyrenoides TaxID=708627 RepID=A0A7S1ERH6_9RHOD